MENKVLKLSTGKMIIACVGALMVLAIAQILAMTMIEFWASICSVVAVGNMIAGILYPSITFIGVAFICKRLLNLSLNECKIPKISIKLIWCITAVIMPVLVSICLLLCSGHLDKNIMSGSERWAIITAAVAFYGLGTGIVEEMVFRGVIMSALEYRYNRVIAIMVPSVIFALGHILGRNLDFLSIIQLLVAGSSVGILFSLVTYESDSIWGSALIHGVWNMIIIGDILHIGDSASETAIYNYVLDTESRWISGGDFGIEASIISIVVYLFFIVLAGVLYKRKVHR